MTKHIDEITKQQQEYKQLLDKLDWIEEEFYWHNKEKKTIKDYLLEIRSQTDNAKLQHLLLEKEEIADKTNPIPPTFISDCKKAVGKLLIDLEREKEQYSGEFATMEKNNI